MLTSKQTKYGWAMKLIIKNGYYKFYPSFVGEVKLFENKTGVRLYPCRDFWTFQSLVDISNQFFTHLQGTVCQLSHRTADANGIVIAQIAANLADDHWNGIGGKLDVHFNVEIIHRLDQANASDLKKIVHIFFSARKSLNDRKNQS